MIYYICMDITYRLHRRELRPRRFLNFVQSIFGVAEYSVRRMSSKAAEQFRASRVQEMRLNTMSILHGCESFDEFDLRICVEGIDQEENDGYLFLEQGCCDWRLVFEIKRERRGVVVRLDFLSLLLASYEGVDGAMRWKISCILEFGEQGAADVA